MSDKETLGITFSETMAGGFALGATDPSAGNEQGNREGTELAMHATISIDDLDGFIGDPRHLGKIHGSIDFTPFGEGLAAPTGVFNLFSPTDNPAMKYMVYELGFQYDGQSYYLAGRKEVHDDVGFDLWSDTTTLLTKLHRGTGVDGEVIAAGVLSLGVKDLIKLVSTMRAIGAESPAEKAVAYAKFGRFFMAELWDSYAKFLTPD